ncbi:MAG: wax ester/triacylglycerol synthase family O-acyltransferase [Halioglobus sp.]
MPITDAFFLLMESRRVPMHVGGLNLFTLPKGVDDTSFLANLEEILKYDGELRRPFGEKLKMGPLGAAGKIGWEEDDELDMDYHIRHSALPKPGRYRELFALVSRLHGQLLDRSRPMWEMHLIEGLKNRQFATYFKTHHCAIDGVGALRLMSSMYSTNARTKLKISPLSALAHEEYKRLSEGDKTRRISPREDEIKSVAEVLQEQLGSTRSISKAMQQTAAIWMGRGRKMAVPFHQIPNNPYSTQLTGARRFVAQSWSFERVKNLGKVYDCTLNDMVLAMCAGALRKQLLDVRALPKQSLKAMAPVSVRAQNDVDSANAVGMVVADLATNIKDPEKRLRKIRESMISAKGLLSEMNSREIQVYTGITQAPMLLTQITGQGSRFPAFSTVVSNVPGPRERRYWNGARLDGIYPVSIPFDGSAVNFTVVSNFKNLDFGIVACRKSVPHVQRLIDYMEESLIELEQAAGLLTSTGRRRKISPETKTKAKPIAKTRKKPSTSATKKAAKK